jgi:ribosomal protein S18 acetylase RimI-like enzyme
MNNVIVEKLQPGDLSETARVLSHAFMTEPNVVAVWRRQDEHSRRDIETVFRIAKLDRPFATVLVAKLEGRIAGALNMTQWPHCQPSFGDRLRLLPLMIRRPPALVWRSIQLQSAFGRHDPRKQHWHLGPVGVLPQLQGTGIGSRMMLKCCEMLDQKKDAAWLETDRTVNVPFYERFGFTVTDEEEILGVRNWFMWRSPR